LYALATALCWAVAVILFKRSGESFSPFGLNTFKNVVGLVLLGVTLPFAGGWTDAPAGHIAALLASGAVGIGIADTLFFYSLNTLGAARQAIVDTSYSPVIVTLSFLLLGERLEPLDGLGAALIIGAMLLVVTRKPEGALPRKQVLLGVAAGLTAMVSMGASIVVVKPLLDIYDVAFATLIRVIGGLAVLALIFVVHGPSRRGAVEVFRPQAAWRWAIPGSVMGAYLSLVFWIAGFKYNSASVASILNQTTTLFIVLLAAAFLKEPLTPRRSAAVLLGFIGSVVVLL